MYTTYFGFREQPFNSTPDPRFVYSTFLYRKAFDSLFSGIRGRKGLALLTGEVGTGKTTLLRLLIDHFDETVDFACVYHTIMTFHELLSCISEDLGLRGPRTHCPSSTQILPVFTDFLQIRSQEGRTVVLLIDEAQNLENKVLKDLRLLSDLETASGKLLQIILAGQPELERKLAHPQLRQLTQHIRIRCNLTHLQDREVGPFLSYRLRVAGCERQDLFPPETVERIAAYAQGIPRLINIICDNALLIAYGISQQTVSPDIIDEVAHDLRLKTGSGKPTRQSEKSITAPPISPVTNQPARSLSSTPSSFQPLPRRLRWRKMVLLLMLFCGVGVVTFLYKQAPRRQTQVEQQIYTQEIQPKTARQSKTDKTAQAERVVALFRRAEQQMAALRLTTPAGDNARETYQEILRLAPRYRLEALAGVQQIAAQYAQWAEEAQQRAEWERATVYYHKALALTPQDGSLAERLEQIKKREAGEKEQARDTLQAALKERAEARARLERIDVPYQREALVKSAANGDARVVALFLTAGMSPNVKDTQGWTALMRAASNGHTALVQLLVTKGAAVNATNNQGRTALMCAALNNHLHIVQTLLAAGAQVNVRDRDGRTALSYVKGKVVFEKNTRRRTITTLLKQAGATL